MSKIYKRINKLKIELFDLIEQQNILKAQYQRLEDLKNRKIQELYAARKERQQAQDVPKATTNV